MKEVLRLADESYFLIEEWQTINSNLYAGITTRQGGHQSRFAHNNLGFHVNDDATLIVKNREKLAENLKFPLNSWVCSEQTHGSKVVQVLPTDKGKGSYEYNSSIKDCDGLYTTHPKILLGLTYADCVPIFFYSPKTHAVGIVHAGWRGTVRKISQNLIRQWLKLGIKNEDILAVVGPSICKNCYTVDKRVINEVKELNLPNVDNIFEQVNEKEYKLDLQSLNKLLLMQLIPESNIKVTNYCTSCHNDIFYSHRKEKGSTGRIMGFIGFREE